MSITLLGAFVGGVLTLLSPCSVMLLPAFFSYAFADPKKLLARTGIFYLGLITTLVPLGVLAGSLGGFFNEHRHTFVIVAGSIVILLGLVMLLGIPLPFMRDPQAVAESTSSASVYALGTVYGLAGVCAGPLLGAVLAVAAVSGNALWGGIVLLVFAAGMALPLLLLALLWGRMPWVKNLVKPREVRIGKWRNTWTGIVGGILTVGLGILLIATQGTESLAGFVDASTALQLEGWAQRATQVVPNWAVLTIAGVIVGAWLLIRHNTKSRTLSHTDH